MGERGVARHSSCETSAALEIVEMDVAAFETKGLFGKL